MKHYLPKTWAVCACLFFSTTIFATSYHTISIDGTNDFAADEDFAGTSGSTWYVTWDATNIYFATDNADVDDNDANKWVHIYIDTDPTMPATGGTGTTTGINYNNQQPGLPFTANYHFRWRTDNMFQGLEVFSGASWGSGSIAGINTFQSNTYVEFSIPRANLGNPDAIYFASSMINEVGGGEFTFFMFPNGNTEGNDTDYTEWYTFILDDGLSPDDGGNLNRVLPVEFGDVSAQALPKEGIEVAFSTLVEENNSHFEIERSTDSRNWKTLGQIQGAGNTQSLQQYAFVDKSPREGLNYYRIRQIDFDGTYSYSRIVGERWQAELVIRFFPNPAKEQLQLQFAGAPPEEEIEVRIVDMTGRLWLNQVWSGQPIDLSRLTSGTYNISLSGDGVVQHQERLVVQ